MNDRMRLSRTHGLVLALVSSFLVISLPALAAPAGAPTPNHLRIGAVHASYALTQSSAATVTPTVTPTVRWDLTRLVQQTVLAGGVDTGRDAARNETIALTGSGDVRTGIKDAAGGGTYVMRHEVRGPSEHDNEIGTVIDQRGIYVVTGFVSWQPAGGTLGTTNDGIGRPAEASAGILTLNVRLYPTTGGHQDGVLTINAHLTGEMPAIAKGITLAIDGFFFVQHTGAALFHVQQ
jgi:hypothetical protein